MGPSDFRLCEIVKDTHRVNLPARHLLHLPMSCNEDLRFEREREERPRVLAQGDGRTTRATPRPPARHLESACPRPRLNTCHTTSMVDLLRRVL